MKKLTLILFAVLCRCVFAGCSGDVDSEAISEELNEFITHQDDGTTVVYTKVGLQNEDEKKSVTAIFSEDEEKYYCHFLMVGDKVYLDDGTIE